MRVVLRVIATLLLVVGVPVAWMATATAEAPTQAGWWWKVKAAETPEAPAVPAPVPVEVTATKPPTVPEGGLLIANDPSGPAAVAALQLFADEGATGTLTLTVADGGAGDPLIVACPAVGVWEAEEGGAWEKAPKYDCAVGKIAGEVADGTVTFALDPSLAAPGGGYDVVLLPDPDSGTPFQTPFEAPADDAWEPVGGESDDSEGDVFSDEVTDTASETDSSFESGGGSVESGGSGLDTDFSSSSDVGASLEPAEPPLDSGAAAQPGAPAAGGGEQVAGGPAQAIADDDANAERLTAIGLLVLLAGGLFWVSNRQGAAAAAVAPAGVGRFARPRIGRPNGLS